MSTSSAGARQLAWCALYVCSLTVASGARTAYAQQDSTLQDALVELRVLHGPAQIMEALTRDSTLFLAVHQFQDLVEVRSTEFVAGSRVAAVLEPEDTRIVFDTEEGQVRRGDSVFVLSKTDFAWRDQALFVSTEAVARAFDVSIAIDWEDLLVVVRGADHLPIVRRLKRTKRRGGVLASGLGAPPPFTLPLRRNFAEGAVLDWAVTSATHDPLGASSLGFVFGTQLIGGSLDVRYLRRSTAGAHRTFAEGSWTKAWPYGSWLRQLRLGNGLSTGRTPYQLFGMSLTNAPFQRAYEVVPESVYGALSQGWEVELYRSGHLVGFATSDDTERYGFDVPLHYGRNSLELISYGPLGEVRQQRRTIVVSPDRLPPGQFEYGFAAGACATDSCRAMFNVDTRYGLGTRFTLQAGSDYFWRDTLPELWRPYARLSATVTQSVHLAIDALANGRIAGYGQFVPTPDFEVSVEHVDFARAGSSENFAQTPLRRRTQAVLAWRLGRARSAPRFRLSARRAEGSGRKNDAIRLSSSTRIHGTHVQVGFERRSERVPQFPRRVEGVIDLSAASVLLGPSRWLRSTLVTGELAWNFESGLNGLGGRVARPIADGVRFEFEATWRRGFQGFAIDLTIVTALSAFRGVSRNSYSQGAGLQGTQSIEGSLLWDGRSRRVAFADGRSVGRAGLVGDVFLDENRNGRFDPSEIGVRDIRLRVGPRAVTTDSMGRFASWDLVPFEPVRVAIDTLSIRNPLWVPATPLLSVVPGPNSFSEIQIPLVRAGELNGRIVIGQDERGVGGVKILLQDISSGVTTRETSFSDGAFFFYGLKPGRYELVVDPEDQVRLGATADAALLVIDSVGGESILENVVLRLRQQP